MSTLWQISFIPLLSFPRHKQRHQFKKIGVFVSCFQKTRNLVSDISKKMRSFSEFLFLSVHLKKPMVTVTIGTPRPSFYKSSLEKFPNLSVSSKESDRFLRITWKKKLFSVYRNRKGLRTEHGTTCR